MSDDDDESDGQMGKKVDSNEVKCLKERDRKWDDLVDENKRLNRTAAIGAHERHDFDKASLGLGNFNDFCPLLAFDS